MLDEGDKAIVRQIAFEAGEVISHQISNAVKDKLDIHVLSCPIKTYAETNDKRIKEIESWPKQAKLFSKGFILGIVFVSSAVGSGITLLVTRLAKLFL